MAQRAGAAHDVPDDVMSAGDRSRAGAQAMCRQTAECGGSSTRSTSAPLTRRSSGRSRSATSNSSGSSTPTPPSTPCDRPIVRGNGQSPRWCSDNDNRLGHRGHSNGVAAALAVAAGCVAELFFVDLGCLRQIVLGQLSTDPATLPVDHDLQQPPAEHLGVCFLGRFRAIRGRSLIRCAVCCPMPTGIIAALATGQ